jgi:hypothetical protein
MYGRFAECQTSPVAQETCGLPAPHSLQLPYFFASRYCLASERFSFDFIGIPFILFASTTTKEQYIMLESTLEKLAEKILGIDEASLTNLWEKYKTRMEQFDASKEWEKAVIIFFIINSVRAKNHIFNENILKLHNNKEKPPVKPQKKGKPDLRLVK